MVAKLESKGRLTRKNLLSASVFTYRFDSPLQTEIHKVVQSSTKEQNTNQEKIL